MINKLNPHFVVLAKAAPSTIHDISILKKKYFNIPEDYLDLIQDATEIEIQHDIGTYIRIWGPLGCVEMDEAYEISARIHGAFPIGDDGGGRAILYMNGINGFGLYLLGFGDLDADDSLFISNSMRDLLIDAKGIEVF